MKERFISRGLMMLLVFTMSFLTPAAYAQGDQQERITISANQKPLEQVLEKLGKDYNYQVFYNTSLVKGIKVSAKLKNATMDEIMQQLLKDTKLQYNIKGKTIVITATPKNQGPNKTLLSGVVVDNCSLCQGLGSNVTTSERPSMTTSYLPPGSPTLFPA